MKFKKIIAMVAAVSMLLPVITGCNSKSTTSKTDENTLTIFYHGTDGPFDDEWPVYQKAAELTGIKLKGIVSKSQTDRFVAFNTTMATKPLPDIIGATGNGILEYATMGAFTPLDDLIDKYAPNIKKYFEENPDVRQECTGADGKIYFIPSVQTLKTNNAWFIRKDWLDKAGLEVPQTVDELYNAVKILKDSDPNGNGKKDEVGLFARFPSNFIIELMCLFGVKSQSKGYCYVDDDGVIKASYYDKEFKEAVKNIAKWYSEGIIDKELYTRTNARDTLLSNDQGIATFDAPGSTSNMNRMLNEKIDGFNFEIMLHPEDIYGKRWDNTAFSAGNRGGWGISADNKKPIETIKYFDFWYTEEGKILNSMGVEGVSYVTENGERVFTDDFAKNPQKALNQTLTEIGAIKDIGGFITMEYWKGMFAPEVYEKILDLENNVNYLKPFPQLTLNEKETVRSRDINAAVKSYVEETMQKWVMGTESVDETWDEFIKQLKVLGVDELIDIYNNAYKNMNKE